MKLKNNAAIHWLFTIGFLILSVDGLSIYEHRITNGNPVLMDRKRSVTLTDQDSNGFMGIDGDPCTSDLSMLLIAGALLTSRCDLATEHKICQAHLGFQLKLPSGMGNGEYQTC